MGALRKLLDSFKMDPGQPSGRTTGDTAQTNLADLENGFYEATLDGYDCIVAVGSHSSGNAGMGFAGLSCNYNKQAVGGEEGLKILRKVSDFNIGDLANGVHDMTVSRSDGSELPCKVVIGNHQRGMLTGRGYAALTCDFTK